ncbi:hypothetical protein AUP68_07720 [Ilyonectria robusta]
MMVVFALATVAHVVQAVIYCKPYCWTIAMSGLLQALAYLFRILSIGNPTSLPLYATWFVLILVCIQVSMACELASLNLEDCANLDQCICIHDFRSDGLELHKSWQAFRIKRMETRAILRRFGYHVRICFRLVEYAGGLDSSIPRHEAYQYCFDSLLMLIASCIFNIVHPGRIMAGKQGDLPNKSARKLRAMGSEVREGSISLSNPENSDA